MGSSKRKSSSAENGDNSVVEGEISHSDKLKLVNKIAKPMAGKKLSKKLLKLVKKASKDRKNNLVYGLKAVQKSLRKGESGLMILAGDVYPIEIMCHIPGVCEELALPYCYVPSRSDIAGAMGTFRSILLTLIKSKPDYKELFDECKEEITTMPQPVWIEDQVKIKTEPVDVE